MPFHENCFQCPVSYHTVSRASVDLAESQKIDGRSPMKLGSGVSQLKFKSALPTVSERITDDSGPGVQS